MCMTDEFIKCPQCSQSIRNQNFCHHCGWSRPQVGAVGAAGEDSTKDSDPSIRLLREIEKNTSNTHFWTMVTGIPVLLGMIAAFIAMGVKGCS